MSPFWGCIKTDCWMRAGPRLGLPFCMQMRRRCRCSLGRGEGNTLRNDLSAHEVLRFKAIGLQPMATCPEAMVTWCSRARAARDGDEVDWPFGNR